MKLDRRFLLGVTGLAAFATTLPERTASALGLVPKAAFAPTLNAYAFGAVGDGIANDTVAIQNLITAAAGQCALIPPGRYLVTNYIRIPDNTTIQGCGKGSVFVTTGTQVFQNSNWATSGPNTGIVFKDLVFDGNAIGNSPISIIGATNCAFYNLTIRNMLVSLDISVGIAIGTVPGMTCSGFLFSNVVMDVPDYGIVLDSGADVGGVLSNIDIVNCQITVHWGSCISLARCVKDVTITGCLLETPGDSPQQPNSGIGIKMWQGYAAGNAINNVTISGCAFRGTATAANRVSLWGLSLTDATYAVAISGCTFTGLFAAFQSNFSANSFDFAFTGNVVDSCVNGVVSNQSADPRITINANTFSNISNIAADVAANYVNINDNKFANIGGAAINGAVSNFSTVNGNQFFQIGREAVNFNFKTGANNVCCLINGNVMSNCCTAADNTNSVIAINSGSHVVNNNIISNALGGNLPAWCILRAVGSANVIMTGNWMYGARQGYISIAAAGNDQIANNLQRGGIG